MPDPEIIDIVTGLVGLGDVAVSSPEVINVQTNVVSTIHVITGTVGALQVVSEEIGAADLITDDVDAVAVIMGPPGPTGPAGADGATGPAGPPGPAGSAAAVHQNFVIAATEWLFVHNLGYQPVVTLYDPLGVVILGDIEENTTTTTRVEWYYPIAGMMALL